MPPFTQNHCSFVKERLHKNSEEAEGLLHITHANPFETQVEYVFAVSLLRLSVFSFLTRAEGGEKKIARCQENPAGAQHPGCPASAASAASPSPLTLTPASFHPPSFPDFVHLVAQLSFCPNELKAKRYAVAPDIVRGRGVRSRPSRTACRAALQSFGATFDASFHNGIRREVEARRESWKKAQMAASPALL